MSVIGSLEDLSFPDILQVIHLGRQPGTIVVSSGGSVPRVAVRHG